MRLSNKLDFAKLELFRIFKILGLVMYKLDFPDSIKITKIRYVLVLKLANLEVTLIKIYQILTLKAKKRFGRLNKY